MVCQIGATIGALNPLHDRRLTKRLASLFLLLVLFSGAFAGMPLPFGGSDCGMSGMMDMDCCNKARLQELTPEVADAKLCCALNCAQSGTTSPPGSVRITPPAPARVLQHVTIASALPTPLFRAEVFGRLHSPPGSPPTYLRNLTLLI